MSARTAWRCCAAAGALAFLCSWLFGRIPGLVACGPAHGLGPIIAFELARDAGEVATLFGAPPCRTALVAAQRTALLLDGLGFIPAYTAFLIFAARAAAGLARWRWALIAAFAVAGLCDEIEGGLLDAILRHLPGTPALLATLWGVVRLKFALLGLGTLALGIVLVLRRRVVPLLFGAVVCGGAVEALYGLATLPSAAMMAGFALGWVALLLTALAGAFAASLFSPRSARPPRAPAGPAA